MTRSSWEFWEDSKLMDRETCRWTGTRKERNEEKQCCKWAGGEHTHAHTHMQTGWARNEPGQKIRFLGGFAMGTGLQSAAAWGRGRSRGMWWRGNGDSVIKPVQLLGWANGQFGNPTSITVAPLHDPVVVVSQRQWRQRTKPEKKVRI